MIHLYRRLPVSTKNIVLAALCAALVAGPAGAEELKAKAVKPATGVTMQRAAPQPTSSVQQSGSCDSRSPGAQPNPACSTPKTNDGLSGGHAPGASGAAMRQGMGNSNKMPQRGTAAALPINQFTADKNDATKNDNPAHPGDLSRENRMRNLIDPSVKLKELTEGKGDRLPGQKNPQDLLDSAGATPTLIGGRNQVSKTEQQGVVSEKQYKNMHAPNSHVTEKKNEYGGRTYQDGDNASVLREAKFDKQGHLREVRTYNNDTGVRMFVQYDKDGNKIKEERKEKSDNKRPDPTSDTGNAHLPKGFVSPEHKEKSIAERKEEKKRQVTLPNEGHAVREAVRFDPIEATKYNIKKKNEGYTNPVRGDGTETGRTPRPGMGPEQVDYFGGKRVAGGIGPNTGRRPGGTTPDNPTATNGDTPSSDGGSSGNPNKPPVP